MDIKKYILKIIKDEETKNRYLAKFKITGLSEDQKIYLIAKMLRSMNEEESDNKEFAKNFDEIHLSKSPIRETILLSHMAIEHFLDKYLDILLPNNFKIPKQRLNFDLKLYLCSASDSGIGFLYNEIKTINNMRNKLAHNPNYNVLNGLKMLVNSDWIKSIISEIETIKEETDIINLSCRAICSIIHGIICEALRDKRDNRYPSYKQFVQ
ncbi:hypothetical protein [Legionella jamestowniensis]|uniref:Uncharacterized protein n=1 Tax=Legionella jamestowniensis TaxID=455 RepID=A0A0W0UI20_9GAMM|nr:hypothetical protein [Legionella jamestowniensis]KTD07225.1 hypothetical protein Ljam_1420 [Legionella jamestowniensis]SFL96018.1 hypothetical protein SAMN02746073_2796 [Legionella jamestowniensis DSM 19215]